MIYSPHHVAISVRRLDQSLEFYTALGYTQVHRYDDEQKTNVHLKLGDVFLEVFAYKQNYDAPPLNLAYANNLTDVGVKHIALKTDDVDAALVDLKSKGLADESVKIETAQDLRYFFIKDPDGVWVEIIKDDRYS